MEDKISQVELAQQKQFRIIPSTFPPINFFEDLVDPSEMEALFEIESMTNERIRQEVGDIFLVAPQDRISGPGSSVVMASFTHIFKPSRFSDGSFGVYYAALLKETAIRETVYHRENFLRATQESPGEITMRVYEGTIKKPLHDIRDVEFSYLHHPNDYGMSQQFGAEIKKKDAWGLIYRSVRHEGGICIAAFKPAAVSIPKQISHLRYVWDGEKIAAVFDAKLVMEFV